MEREDFGLAMTAALRRIAAEDRGVVVVLAGDENPAALLSRLAGDPVAATSPAGDAGTQREWRQLGLGAQILADLGVRRLRVLGTPRKLVGLAGFDLEVVEYVEEQGPGTREPGPEKDK
jgi:3,4-dihydroxy 2-butanone 4-phosphate synthase/GTP cyclohydrolase II